MILMFIALSAAVTSVLAVVVGPQGILLPVFIILFLLTLRGYVRRKPIGSVAFWVLGIAMLLGLCAEMGYLLRIPGVPGLDIWSNSSIVLALTAATIAIRLRNTHEENHTEQQARHASSEAAPSASPAKP